MLQWTNLASEATSLIWATSPLCFPIVQCAPLEHTPTQFLHSMPWTFINWFNFSKTSFEEVQPSYSSQNNNFFY
jgi:hypothetical protein